MDWQQEITKQRCRAVEAENKALKVENESLKRKVAEYEAHMDDTRQLLTQAQKRLALAKQVTRATQRRQLRQKGINENIYNVARKQDAVYMNLWPGSIRPMSFISARCNTLCLKKRH